MDAISKRLEQAYPETNQGRGAGLSPLDQELFGDIRGPLVILLAAVGLVLLIACSNVANLLLVRSEARQREMAVRTALGAGRARVLGQLTTESCLLALLGAAGGLLFARWGVHVLVAASPITFPSYVDPSIDLRVMLFALALTCGVGILLGLAPAVHLRSMELHDVFKQSSHQSSAGRQGRGFRNLLVVAQVALAMLLLVGAGLLMRSLQQVMALRLGYDPAGLLTMRVSLPSLGSTASSESGLSAPTGVQAGVSARELLARVAGLPGVESVALGSDSPLTSSSAISYAAEGQPLMTAENRGRAYRHDVTPDFFRTLRIPFVAGRAFTEADLQGSSDVVVVSENVAKRFWPGEDPIGKRIRRVREGSDDPWLAVVGVVNEMKYRGLPENDTNDPDLFFPYSGPQENFTLLVRTSGDPSPFANSVRTVLRETDAGIVAYKVDTLSAAVARETSHRRFTSWLMGIFAGSALLLATIGLYGVMAYGVTQRTQEIGIRVAMGAARFDVLRLVTGGGLGLVACGLAVGFAAALALTRWIDSLIYGIQPSDPLTYGGAGLVLTAVAVLASLAPALRATRIAPAKALRDD